MAQELPNTAGNDKFYLRYYVGHHGKFGHEFLEFEFLDNGLLRYANNSKYKGHDLLKKQVYVSPAVIKEVKRIIDESDILKEDDKYWPEPDDVGRQEIEILHRNNHISFLTTKIGSLIDIQDSEDQDGLKCFYYLVQDLKCLVFSLITVHFKIKPIQN
eukprot:CAMPEP_0197022344 /NCGR_PEP_ID=MMETSP1384-20130603/3261_1 /TAXON_ID=29189 /ORGANISM="Ammonia sp." /LENGTH=157 /DNA_ID=CAMNT_0042450377 /DNA_START=36 /DNA_END=509 /DNA_ORIENTATION=+